MQKKNVESLVYSKPTEFDSAFSRESHHMKGWDDALIYGTFKKVRDFP